VFMVPEHHYRVRNEEHRQSDVSRRFGHCINAVGEFVCKIIAPVALWVDRYHIYFMCYRLGGAVGLGELYN